MEIRDSLTAELLSTLQLGGFTPVDWVHAYSPDGRSLACPFDTAIIVWDIQTGGVAKEIQLDERHDCTLVWSLDGRSICAMTYETSTVRFDVVSDTKQSSTIPHSKSRPHVWAHNESFRVMTWTRTDQVRDCTIDIFEVGPTLTKIESFDIGLGESDHFTGREANWEIGSFSPTTYRISVSSYSRGRLLVLDIRNSERLLDETQRFYSDSFSPDGGFFAASQDHTVQIWKYDGSSYAAWRKLPTPDNNMDSLIFSPTSSSVFGAFEGISKVWHLGDLSARPTSHSKQFGVLPRSGAYLVTTNNRGNTVTITDVLSRTPLQLIHTDIKICQLRLTGNVLLVQGSEVVVAWLLTEEGLVNGVFGDRIAGRGDSIWTVPMPELFSVKGETAVIRSGDTSHAYNTRTGETLNVSQVAPDRWNWHLYSLDTHLYDGSIDDAPPRDNWNPLRNVRKGWVGDRGGRHLLWLPIEWREAVVSRFSDIGVIQFWDPSAKLVTIKLY